MLEDNQHLSVNYRSIKKNALKNIVNIGDVFGVFKVIEEVKVKTEKCNKTLWKTVNINTGEEYITSGSYLYEIKRRTDKKFKEQYQLGFRRYLYRYNQKNAKSRNHSYNLIFQQFSDLIYQNCYYCRCESRLTSGDLLKKRGDTKQPPIRYNGIDRLDPNIGYQLDNCVPCCPKCNYMKHVMQEQEFLDQVEKIYKFKIDKSSTTIENVSNIDISEQSTL